jgi:hypothetical protein
LNGAFGFAGWKDIYTGRYRWGGLETTVFISRKTNINAARQEAESFLSFLEQDGGKKEKGQGLVPGNVLLKYLGSFEAIFSSDKFIAGVHEGENLKLTEGLCQILYNNLQGRK